jgi:hypothetical protein
LLLDRKKNNIRTKINAKLQGNKEATVVVPYQQPSSLGRDSKRDGCYDVHIMVANDVNIMAAIAFRHVFSKK